VTHEHLHERLLLSILRDRWEELADLAGRPGFDGPSFVELCRSSAVHAWVHARLDEQGQWDRVGPQVESGLARLRAKVRNDNILLLARAEQALDALLSVGVVPVALKGLDTLQRIYTSFDQRSLDDVDLLVRRDDLRKALAALEQAGWQVPAEPSRTHYIRSSHHLPMRSPGPIPVEFEIHWSLAQEGRYRIDVEGLIERARPFSIEGREVLRLDDTDLIAHLLIHHFSHYFDRSLKWLVDMAGISRLDGFSWDDVVARIESWGAVTASGASLAHIHKMWPELIPERVAARLPVSRWRWALTRPLRSNHPLELFRHTRNRRVQLYLAAVMLERPATLPGWLLHRATRDRRQSENPLDEAR